MQLDGIRRIVEQATKKLEEKTPRSFLEDIVSHRHEVAALSVATAVELQRIRQFVEDLVDKNGQRQHPTTTSLPSEVHKKGVDDDVVLSSDMAFTRPYVNPKCMFELQYWICQGNNCSVVLRTDRDQYDIFFCHYAANLCDVIRGNPKNTWFKWEHDEISVWALSSHNHSGKFHKIPLAKRKTGVQELHLHECDREKCVRLGCW
jgi:hypothetical protein